MIQASIDSKTCTQGGWIDTVEHAPDAKTLRSAPGLEFKLSSTPELCSRDLKIVLYCKTSGRAALAACALHDMGYLQVKSLAGGFDAWAGAGKPVIQPTSPTFE